MSEIGIKSPKHCAKKGLVHTHDYKVYKKLFLVFATLFTSILSLIFLFWFILHPAKPQFSLQQAEIYKLTFLSGSDHLLNSSIQITLLSKNPNQKVGIYYDDLQAYASYRGQQITVQVPLPPFYQDRQEANLLSASLSGTGLPVAPSLGYEVVRDQTAGKLVLSLRISGRVKWKVGAWVSGPYHLNVNCVGVMASGPYVAPSGIVSIKQGAQCSTAV